MEDIGSKLPEKEQTDQVENHTDAEEKISNDETESEDISLSSRVNGCESPELNSEQLNIDDDDEGNSSDSMPDLIWPEKKTKKKTGLTSSTSRDTGFCSDSTGNTPSPDNASRKIEETISKSSSDGSTATPDDEESQADEERDGVLDILGNGLLKKKVLTEGKGVDTRPSNGDRVTLKVDGLLHDGTHVDTGEISFILNDGDVILAFDIAVALMEAGETCELFTASKYAYGSIGRQPDIPKDADITYTLELLSIEPSPEISTLKFEQRLKLGEDKRERGNYLFGRADYSGAINSYNKAIKLLADSDYNASLDEAARNCMTEAWVKCYNNMAACQLKIEAHDAAIRSCEKVLSQQRNNIKALFRIGKAYAAKGDIELAIDFVRQAIKLDPDSKLLHQEMLSLTRRKKKETATERELYQRMLGVKPGDKNVSPSKPKSSSSLIKWTLLAGGVAAVLVSVSLSLYRGS
ncbi:peptidyl-prolyl cis-trans isomerase FKBP8-like [Physella acuta]|uniref:peptidyl-prolyl cis-trans isomerase FKBP8-like n=1 Tax=Physella acuta TaxID=109671 RepID=UPI0027DB11F3|nr:peptidyl-prolyl cis-trans isomerase FKBP8-like [Physella acuta]